MAGRFVRPTAAKHHHNAWLGRGHADHSFETPNGTIVTSGEQPTGDVVIESMTLDGPEQQTFHPAWLLSTTQETAAALREELDVGAIQSFDEALHHNTETTS